jgi:vacuolar-type H+-ATPase subunit I/STV1
MESKEEKKLLSEEILPKEKRQEIEDKITFWKCGFTWDEVAEIYDTLLKAELQAKGFREESLTNWNSLQASEERVRQAVKFIKEKRATTPGMGALLAILTEYQEIKDPEKEKLEERVKELEGTLNHANKVIADKIKESIELHSSLDHDKNRIKELESEVEKLKGLIEEAWEAGYDYGAGYLSATTFDQWKEAKGIK